jgi:hypothetical protein
MSNNFSTWKTIKIETYSDVESLKEAILNAGFHIGSWAEDVLESQQFVLSSKESEVDLVRVTPKDLGFPDGAYRRDIYKKALSLGLKLCTLDVGPQLRLQYTDQPRLESLQVGMEPQVDSEGHESEFRVVHGGDDFIWLVGDHKHPTDFWRKEEYFIFTK